MFLLFFMDDHLDQDGDLGLEQAHGKGDGAVTAATPENPLLHAVVDAVVSVFSVHGGTPKRVHVEHAINQAMIGKNGTKEQASIALDALNKEAGTLAETGKTFTATRANIANLLRGIF